MTGNPTLPTGPLWPVRAELPLTDPAGHVLLIGARTRAVTAELVHGQPRTVSIGTGAA
ncbi:hypothetical protein GCM10010519_00980 [Streptomyces lactacystinicus]